FRQPSRDLETLQTRFALRGASRLSEAASLTSHDVDERLRFARQRALERAHAARQVTQTADATFVNGVTLAFAGESQRSPWWMRLATLLPLAVLLAGLTLIQQRHSQVQIEAAAEIDAAILADD